MVVNEAEALGRCAAFDRLSPGTWPASVLFGLIKNPNVTAAMFGIDVNYLQVKINEGALLPTVTFQASVHQSYEQTQTIFRSFSASALEQLSVPVYQAVPAHSLIRQSTQTFRRHRLVLGPISS